MSHEAFDTLAAVYAVGALDGDDLHQFEAHLAAGCEQCEATLRETHEALARLTPTAASSEAAPQVPPHVKDALLRRLAGAPRWAPARRSWAPWAVATAAAAVASAMLTGGFVASRYEAQLGHMAREMSRLRQESSREELALRTEMAGSRAAVELLRDPATKIVELHGAGLGKAASGRILWNERAGGHLVVANLPAPAAGQAYELWILGGAAPKPAGVFTVDASGSASQKLEASAETPVKAFAITIEPEAGVPAPTGPVVLASR